MPIRRTLADPPCALCLVCFVVVGVGLRRFLICFVVIMVRLGRHLAVIFYFRKIGVKLIFIGFVRALKFSG